MRASRPKAALASMVIAISLLMPAPALARVGVGVDVGTITVDQTLDSGGMYDLPSIGVINTGDEPATYIMKTTPLRGQKELLPDGSWFTFTPASLPLAPGLSAPIQPRLSLPLNTPPGEYFVLLMANSSQTATAPGANIAVAAGTKLRFTVRQTNFFLAVYYRVRDLMQMYSPWSWVALAAIVVLAVGLPLARRYRISLGVERRSTPE
jgi:hypothetical protein